MSGEFVSHSDSILPSCRPGPGPGHTFREGSVGRRHPRRAPPAGVVGAWAGTGLCCCWLGYACWSLGPGRPHASGLPPARELPTRLRSARRLEPRPSEAPSCRLAPAAACCS